MEPAFPAGTVFALRRGTGHMMNVLISFIKGFSSISLPYTLAVFLTSARTGVALWRGIVLGMLGLVASILPFVAGIKFNSKGEMYASTFLGNIWKIEPVSGAKELVADLCCIGIDNIAIDSKDRIFVSNTLNGRIYEILPDGETRPVNK